MKLRVVKTLQADVKCAHCKFLRSRFDRAQSLSKVVFCESITSHGFFAPRDCIIAVADEEVWLAVDKHDVGVETLGWMLLPTSLPSTVGQPLMLPQVEL